MPDIFRYLVQGGGIKKACMCIELFALHFM